jgi:hypothetical protein
VATFLAVRLVAATDSSVATIARDLEAIRDGLVAATSPVSLAS